MKTFNIHRRFAIMLIILAIITILIVISTRSKWLLCFIPLDIILGIANWIVANHDDK